MSLKHIIDKLDLKNAYVLGIPIPTHYFLLIILIWLTISSLNNYRNQDKWDTLIHEQFRFSIDYPTNWNHDTFGQDGSRIQKDLKASFSTQSFGSFGPTTTVLMIHWLPMEKPTLEQAAEWGREKLAQHEGTISDLSETEVGAGGYPTLMRSFQYTGTPATRIHYYVIRKDGAFILDLYVNNKRDKIEATPVFERMLSSFHMLEWSE